MSEKVWILFFRTGTYGEDEVQGVFDSPESAAIYQDGPEWKQTLAFWSRGQWELREYPVLSTPSSWVDEVQRDLDKHGEAYCPECGHLRADGSQPCWNCHPQTAPSLANAAMEPKKPGGERRVVHAFALDGTPVRWHMDVGVLTVDERDDGGDVEPEKPPPGECGCGNPNCLLTDWQRLDAEREALPGEGRCPTCHGLGWWINPDGVGDSFGFDLSVEDCPTCTPEKPTREGEGECSAFGTEHHWVINPGYPEYCMLCRMEKS